MTGHEFAAWILPRYNFRAAAAALILEHCMFELDDPMSTRGGGWVRFGYNGDRTMVHFSTAQHEAAVHELAHAWWYLIGTVPGYDKTDLLQQLLSAFLHEADRPCGEYQRIGDLCRIYRDGDGETFAGMWIPARNDWNHDEIFAGLASCVMGDMAQLPPSLRSIYCEMFLSLEPVAYLPSVTV